MMCIKCIWNGQLIHTSEADQKAIKSYISIILTVFLVSAG